MKRRVLIHSILSATDCSVRTFLVFALALFAGCTTLPGDVLSRAYKVGTPRANLLPLADQHNLIRLASRARPQNGWRNEMRNKNSAPEKLEALASAFEQKNSGRRVQLGELYLVPPKHLALSLFPDPDTMDEYHCWFFDAQTNLLGYVKTYSHGTMPLKW